MKRPNATTNNPGQTVRERMREAREKRAETNPEFWQHKDFSNGEFLLFPLDGKWIERKGKYNYTNYVPSVSYLVDRLFNFKKVRRNASIPSCTVINKALELAIGQGHTHACIGDYDVGTLQDGGMFHKYAVDSQPLDMTHLSDIIDGFPEEAKF